MNPPDFSSFSNADADADDVVPDGVAPGGT